MKIASYLVDLTPETMEDIKRHYMESYSKSAGELHEEVCRYNLIINNLSIQGDNLSESNRAYRNQVMLAHLLANGILSDKIEGSKKLSKLGIFQ